MAIKQERRDQLSAAALGMSQCAQDLGSKLEALNKTVTTENPWGADGPGSVFGLAYTEVVTHAIETIETHVSKHIEAAEGLVQWVEQSATAESESNLSVAWVGAAMES
jgi:hypothetical protein